MGLGRTQMHENRVRSRPPGSAGVSPACAPDSTSHARGTRAVPGNFRNRHEVKLAAYLARCINIGLYLVLLTPLLVWSGFLQPYITAKVLGFQFLVDLLVAAAFILMLLENRRQRGKTDLFFSPLFVALAAFLGYSLLSACLGTDLSLSLWGLIDRQDGLVLLLHFFAWAALLAWFCRCESPDKAGGNIFLSERGDIRAYMGFSFWVSVAAALWALRDSEVFHDGVIRPLLELLASPTRPGGVFGNSLALGPYLAFHFFLGLYFITGKAAAAASQSRGGAEPLAGLRRPVPYAAAVAFALAEFILLIVIVAGQGRGVLLGLSVGFFVIIVLFIFGPSTKRVFRVLGVAFILCLALVAAVVWHYRDTAFVGRISVLQRMTHVSAAENISTSARLMSWSSGLRGFWDHPLFGWGYNNIYYPLNKYYDPRHVRTSPFLREYVEDTWYDKSHNFFIDMLVERGMVGLLAYAILLGIMARSLWRMSDRRLAICLAGSLAGYLISNAVAFDSFGTLLGFFLTVACILSLGEPEPLLRLQSWFGRNRNVSKPKKRQPVQVQGRPALKIGLVLAVLAAGLYLQVEMAIANHKYVQARAAFAQDPAIGTSLYVDAFGHFSPYDAREKLNCAYLIVNSVITKRQASQSFDAGMLIMRLTAEALAAHPRDAAFYMILNDIYNGLALYVNREFASQAEAFGRKAVELSPNRQEAIFQLARTYVIRNEAGKAVDLNRRMLQSADFPLGHWLLGLSLLQNNQREEAKAEIGKAIEMGYKLTAADTDTLKGLLGEKEFAGLTARK
jgi:O-antigen ligase